MSGEARPSRVEQLSDAPEVGFPGDWYELNTVDHFWFQWRIEAAFRQFQDCSLATDAPWRVLDVGGGRGVLRDQVEARTSWAVDLVELNRAALESAAPGRGRHLYYDVRDLRPDLLGAYDAAILYDVIEHIQEPRAVLDAVRQHLKPGGLLLVNVPALQSLFSAFDVAAGHHRRYDRRTLAAELAGWETLDLRYWGFTLVPLLFLRKLLLRAPTEETIRRGFGPPGAFARFCLRSIASLEMALLPNGPVGTSLLFVGRPRSGA
jgi:SAM-dependent methyltransferase